MRELLKNYKQKMAYSSFASFNIFKDKEGNILKAKDYIKFIIEGKHFENDGIRDGNLVFVEKGFNEDKLPGIYVIQQDDGKYKCRRIISKSAKPENYFYEAYDEEDKPFLDIVEQRQIIGKAKYAFDIPKAEFTFPEAESKNKIKKLWRTFMNYVKK